MDTILDVLGKLFSWVGAVLGPINEKVNEALREKTDFDFAQTTLIPTVLLVIAGGTLGYLAVAPRAGLEAIVTWVLHTNSGAPLLWLVGLIVVVGLLCALLLAFGHRLLLWLWMHVPLNRMRRFELPIVDYERMAASIAEVRRDIDILKRRHNFFDRLIAAIVVKSRSSGSSRQALDVAQEIAKCRVQAARVADAAGRIQDVREVVPIDEPAEPKDDGDNGAAASAGKIFAAMIDGLRPGYLKEIRELSSAVKKFQQSIVATAGMIRECVATARAHQLDELSAHLTALENLSAEVATDLGTKLSYDSWLRGEAWQGGDRLYMNSLAFNLAGTTLERWEDWGPIAKWLNSLENRESPVDLAPIRTPEWKALLEKLRNSRSSIVTYTTVASILVLLAMIGLFAFFSVLGTFRDSDDWWLAGMFSVLVLGAAVFLIAKAFIEPIVAHAFYISIIEARLRNRLGIARPAAKIAWVRRPSRRLSVACGFVAVVILAAVPTWLYGTFARFTDLRLVVVAAQDLGLGDGISTRNMSDLVNVEWRRCASPPAPWAEFSPARLLDTYVAQACKEGKAFAATDLTRRANGEMPARLAAAGVACKGEVFSDIGATPSPPPVQMCRTTINPPKPPPAQLPPSPSPATVMTIPNVTKVEVSATSVVAPKIETRPTSAVMYLGNPMPEPSPLFLVFAGKQEQPQRGHYIGSVKFSFDCADMSATAHCLEGRPPPPDCSIGKSIDENTNKEPFRKIIEQVRTMDRTTKNLVVVGWTDRSGALPHNKRLGEERAKHVAKRIADALPNQPQPADGKPVPTLADLTHILGVGAGNTEGAICDANRRRVDVYMINAE